MIFASVSLNQMSNGRPATSSLCRRPSRHSQPAMRRSLRRRQRRMGSSRPVPPVERRHTIQDGTVRPPQPLYYCSTPILTRASNRHLHLSDSQTVGRRRDQRPSMFSSTQSLNSRSHHTDRRSRFSSFDSTSPWSPFPGQQTFHPVFSSVECSPPQTPVSRYQPLRSDISSLTSMQEIPSAGFCDVHPWDRDEG